MSPFQALYGVTPPSIHTYMLTQLQSTLLTQLCRTETNCLLSCMLSYSLLRIGWNRPMIKEERNENSMSVIGVYLKIHPYRQQSVATSQFNKLTPKFYGPFQIKACIGVVAYQLILPPHSKIHLIFHVSLLERKISDTISPNPTLPPINSTGFLHWQPKE